MSNVLNYRGGFEEFAASKAQPRSVSAVPETRAPVQTIAQTFAFQSYFDSTLLETAILPQTPNNPIVDVRNKEVTGYALGLTPWSQTPIAVQFMVGGQPSSSAPITIKPGEIVRPYGLPAGESRSAFSGFKFGLPFGWLGGGLASLVVFSSPDSDVLWPGNPEIIFHRTRMRIVAPGAIPANARKNWPMRFPWTQAIGNTGLKQDGAPNIAIEPTYTAMSLRTPVLAAPADMRILIQASDPFDRDSAGVPVLSPVRFVDYTWGSFLATGGAGNLGTNYPVDFMPPNALRLAADDGGICLVDMSPGGVLAGLEVDIVRYGRLG